MKILMVHKFYYVEGGAERYVFNLTHLLEKKGHTVIPFAMKHEKNFETEYADYFADTLQVDQVKSGFGLSDRISSIKQFIYNKNAQVQLARLIKDTKPDIAHVHSIYHHLSPSVLDTLKEYNLPVIQTLHDYKLVCPNYIFLNGRGENCEKCKGRAYWHAVTNKCFHKSYSASALIAAEGYYHRFANTYKKNIDLFTSPSRFLGDKVVKYGFPKEKMIFFPYTLPLEDYVPNYDYDDSAIFMGRLTREKGVWSLLQAMQECRELNLKIAGTGPIENELKDYVRKNNMSNVKFLGYLNEKELKKVVAQSRFTIVPSIWHDNSPLVIYESMALGKPVLGAKSGGIPELVDNGKTGYIFEPGNVPDLVEKIRKINNDGTLKEMSYSARKRAEENYAPEVHYPQVIKLYEMIK